MNQTQYLNNHTTIPYQPHSQYLNTSDTFDPFISQSQTQSHTKTQPQFQSPNNTTDYIKINISAPINTTTTTRPQIKRKHYNHFSQLRVKEDQEQTELHGTLSGLSTSSRAEDITVIPTQSKKRKDYICCFLIICALSLFGMFIWATY